METIKTLSQDNW